MGSRCQKAAKATRERQLLQAQLDEEIAANKALTRTKARLEATIARMTTTTTTTTKQPDANTTPASAQIAPEEKKEEKEKETMAAAAAEKDHQQKVTKTANAECRHAAATTTQKEHITKVQRLEFELASARATICVLNEHLLKKTEEISRAQATSLAQGGVDPPTGRVTLAFTDVQGSTALWERNPEAMRLALELHFKILRDALASTGGYEVKTEGDAMMAAF
jgi:hypothetical protein